MKPIGRPTADQQPVSIEFVPKRDLDRAQQEIDRLRKQNERLQQEAERLKQETERLRRELEAALRASKASSRSSFAGQPKGRPEAARPQTGPPLWSAVVPADSEARG